MSLKNDFKFRKLVAEYLDYFFSNGWMRGEVHTQICDYICKINDKCKCSGFMVLKETMKDQLTDNLHSSINYPENRCHTTRELKDLVDRFCLKMDDLVPSALVRIQDIEDFCKIECRKQD